MSLRTLLEQWLNKEKQPKDFPLCDFEKLTYSLRPGDVLLVEGRSRVSEVIRVITQSRWSHSALYLGRLHDIQDENARLTLQKHYKIEPDQQLLVEGILGKGMIVTPLDEYKMENLRVCRPATLSAADAQTVVNYAINTLGMDYDIRQLFDLARFLFPWTFLPRRWRSTLFNRNPDQTTKTVCSSMIAEAFYSVKYPILPLFIQGQNNELELVPRNTQLYTPADFDYSPFFEIKKFPFMGQVSHSPYRDLPWNKDGQIDHENENIKDNQ